MSRPPAPSARIPNRITSEITSRTTEIAAAPIGLSLSICLKMNIEATCVSNGMLPQIRTIEPNSPTARANASAAPLEDRRHEVGQDHAAEDGEADGAERERGLLHLRSSSISTGCTERMTNGSVTNSSASRTANCVKATLMPSGLFGP